MADFWMSEVLELLKEMRLALEVASQANRDGGWSEGSPFQAKIDELLKKYETVNGARRAKEYKAPYGMDEENV